jgi:hypothetical protein
MVGNKNIFVVVKVCKRVFVSKNSESFEALLEIQAKLLSSMVDSHTFMEDVHELQEIMQSIIYCMGF